MIERLPYDGKYDRRTELDTQLGVTGWPLPGKEWNRDVVVTSPSWWHGDEDASQGFLAAMGVNL